MNIRKMALYVAVVALALPAFAASGPMKAGKWQITAETKMEGMDMKMPAMTFERCVTPEEAEKAGTTEPPKGKNDTCKIADYKIDGKTATWKVACDKPQMTGEGTITFAADTFEEEMHMAMKDQSSGQTLNVIQKMSGKRVGDCEPKK